MPQDSLDIVNVVVRTMQYIRNRRTGSNYVLDLAALALDLAALASDLAALAGIALPSLSLQLSINSLEGARSSEPPRLLQLVA